MNISFPFGSPVEKVEQLDKAPKKVFVLGVYASAVHAKWIDSKGKVKVNALAVASEPYIFWKGNNSEQIINQIHVPKELGTLVPADQKFNGPSGNALDELFLKPLGYTRDDAWLCDLLPYSRLNSNQVSAIEQHYSPLVKEYGLPICSIPYFRKSELNNPQRSNELAQELDQSQAQKIIVLGDLPIMYFLNRLCHYSRLSEFVTNGNGYGREHPISINGKEYSVIPLVHPRQAAGLGSNSRSWKEKHEDWINDMNS